MLQRQPKWPHINRLELSVEEKKKTSNNSNNNVEHFCKSAFIRGQVEFACWKKKEQNKGILDFIF